LGCGGLIFRASGQQLDLLDLIDEDVGLGSPEALNHEDYVQPIVTILAVCVGVSSDD